MNRVIRLLGVLPLLFASGNAAPPRVIPEAQEIPTREPAAGKPV